MVINRGDIKRKRKDEDNILLEDSPKRTKVHAQRKFAQGTVINTSPILTPIREFDKPEKSRPDILPEPQELLPMKRPHTEDFLTFLCFRGTTMLPPNLNFFSNATITDSSSEQGDSPISQPQKLSIPSCSIHSVKSESGKERPFIAFGVRKRADPILISKQMDKKRRHALALQALRRKYQEQRMAKIRAVTISQLSEKVTSKSLVRTRSVTKNETSIKKNVTQKTRVKVVSTKVTTTKTSLKKQPMNSQVQKKRMCLRSFRGRFNHEELQVKAKRRKPITTGFCLESPEESKKAKTTNKEYEGLKKTSENKKTVSSKVNTNTRNEENVSSEFSTDDEEPLTNNSRRSSLRPISRVPLHILRKPAHKGSNENIGTKMTRRNMTPVRKSFTTRSQVLRKQKTQITKKIKSPVKLSSNYPILRRCTLLQTKEINKKTRKAMLKKKHQNVIVKQRRNTEKETTNKVQCRKTGMGTRRTKVETEEVKPKAVRKENDIKGEHQLKSSPNVKKSIKLENDNSKIKEEEDKTRKLDVEELKKPISDQKEQEISNKKKPDSSSNVFKSKTINNADNKKNQTLKKHEPDTKINTRTSAQKAERNKSQNEEQKKTSPKEKVVVEESKVVPRPSRKTKEAAAIYMEILGRKLVSEGNIDEDNISIDSFPELPNVRRTEQRENELKAKAKTKTKTTDTKKASPDKKTTSEDAKERAKENVIGKSCEKKSKNNLPGKKGKTIKSDEKDEKIEDPVANDEKCGMSKSPIKIDEVVKEAIELLSVNKQKIDDPDTSRAAKSPSSDLSAEKIKILNEKKAELGMKITKNESLSDSDEPEISQRSSKQLKRKRSIKNRSQSNIIKNEFENSSDSEFDIKLSSNKMRDVVPVITPKMEHSFSDSDEEPLSKLTQAASKDPKKVSNKNSTERQSPLLETKKETRTLNTKRDSSQRNPKKKAEEQEQRPAYSKPKRECTKRPSNYLTMFSSSDDDDKYFHGFVKSENSKQQHKQVRKNTHVVQSADLLCKDVDKRFGKGKVNMSTEQIEKWLKESALAGSDLKKEEEEEDLVKYEDRIPTETLLNTDFHKNVNLTVLKTVLLPETEISKVDIKIPEKSKLKSPLEKNINSKLIKTSERKTIFRKEKKEDKPNTNAFSPDNESSVYAFEAENEDIVSTPFRRPVRRPSSTATSKSEDDDPRAANKFRLPLAIRTETIKSHSKEVSIIDESSSTSLALQVNLESSETFTEGIDCSEEQNGGEQLFYIPIQPGRQNVIQGVAVKLGTEGPNQRVVMKAKLVTQTQTHIQKTDDKASSMFPPSCQKPSKSSSEVKSFQRSKSSDDDFKYKVPSSPSASSSSSTKVCKRTAAKTRTKAAEVICTPAKVADFPTTSDLPQVVEAPVFYPNEKEFQDPLEYIEKIRQKAEKFGICRIVPPSTFKPECKVSDEMRFTAYNQFVHKMLHRWGPNLKELIAIKKYLQTQSINLTHPPWIGGIEVDLPRLYQTVQSLGGLKEVIEKKKWPKVSELMRIPKSAQDRVTKLDDIYCKYLLPYDTLSPAEREKLFDEVETEWAKRESRVLLRSQEKVDNNDDASNQSDSESDDELDECIVKGRNMALNTFFRIARNTMSMWFKATDPSAQEVEQEFWKHVNTRQYHICVHSGSIDSGNWGYGFAVSKNSPFARHAWNLKVLTNNSGSILRSMGPVMGVTVPTLHVGMVFTGCCWYRDPHHLPWIEYLHTGGSKIWYGIPDSMSDKFRTTVTNLVPNYCHNKTIWLPSDTAMVPPNVLVENGVSLCRTVQEPGHYIVVFPKTFTSNICTGYVVSESVYFASANWLKTAQNVFEDMKNSCEPSMFSLDQLILSIAADSRSHVDVLKQIVPKIQDLCNREIIERKKLQNLGLNNFEKVPKPEAVGARRRRKMQNESGDYECEICRTNLFVSWVTENQEESIYCLEHAIENIEKKNMEASNCMLMFTYDNEEMNGLVEKIENTITSKLNRKAGGKTAASTQGTQ